MTRIKNAVYYFLGGSLIVLFVINYIVLLSKWLVLLSLFIGVYFIFKMLQNLLSKFHSQE